MFMRVCVGALALDRAIIEGLMVKERALMRRRTPHQAFMIEIKWYGTSNEGQLIWHT